MSWVLAGLVLVAGAVGPVLLRHRPGLAGPRARARSAHARLGHELATSDVPPGVRAAAEERWTTCGGLLASARTRRELELAEQVASAGLALLEGGQQGR